MKRLNGFSLMEMMIVLTIVAIVAAASAPMVNKKMVRGVAEGNSPWVADGGGGSIAYNLDGRGVTARIGAGNVRALRPSGDAVTPRLYISSDSDNNPHIAFTRGNNNGNPMVMVAGGGNNNIWLSNAAVPAELQNSVVLGTGSRSQSRNTVAIGSGASVRAAQSIALGPNASVRDESHVTSVIIGNNATSGGPASVALGNTARAGNQNTIAIGTSATVGAINSIAIGNGATSTNFADHSIAIGEGANVSNEDAIALGRGATAAQRTVVAIGTGARAEATNCIAIGSGARADHENAIAIGSGAIANGPNMIALGGPNANVLVDRIGPHNSSVLTLGTATSTIYIPGNLIVGRQSFLGVNADKNDKKAAVWLRTYYDKGFLGTANEHGLPVVHLTYQESGGDKGGAVDAPTWVQTIASDRRLKNVGKEFKAGLAEIKKLEVFNYTFKDDKDKTPRVGVMAQDLQKIFPDAVIKGEDGFLRIRMEDMFYALVNAVKELDSRVNLLEQKQKKIDELEKQVDSLEKRLEALEKSKK